MLHCFSVVVVGMFAVRAVIYAVVVVVVVVFVGIACDGIVVVVVVISCDCRGLLVLLLVLCGVVVIYVAVVVDNAW